MNEWLVRVGWCLALMVPTVAIAAVAETTFDLDAGATFALLMVLGIASGVAVDSLVRRRERGAGERRGR